MPTIVDYSIVLQTLVGQGLRCLHYNGGVFGFASESVVYHCGWTLEDDPTLTAAARAMAIRLNPPTVATLSRGLIEIWRAHLAGPLWVLPGSHWAYELTYGGKENLAALLNSVGVASDSLSNRTDAAAIQWERAEAPQAESFLTNLLQMLNVTDFTAVFPESDTVALLHHHHQIWWSTTSKTQNEATAKWAKS